MVITFFGHSTITNVKEIKKQLDKAIKENISKEDRVIFYLGGYGDFDTVAAEVCREINDEYKKRTIFIPIDAGVWPVEPMTDIFDYRKNINPISVIFRLVRTNPSALKKEFGNKDIIFVGSRGYFKIDFNNIISWLPFF